MENYTNQHLLILTDSHPSSLHDLHIFQSTQHLVLHHERRFDSEHRPFLDRKRLVLEGVDRAGCRQIDGDVWPTLHLKGKGLDDAFAGVARVGDGGA